MRKFALLLLLALAGCSRSGDQPWLGYAEGDTAFVAAPQAGWVSNLKVERGAEVKSGELLFSLDDTNQTAARDQAKAQIAQAEGQMGQAQSGIDLARKEFGIVRAAGKSDERTDISENGGGERCRQLRDELVCHARDIQPVLPRFGKHRREVMRQHVLYFVDVQEEIGALLLGDVRTAKRGGVQVREQ